MSGHLITWLHRWFNSPTELQQKASCSRLGLSHMLHAKNHRAQGFICQAQLAASARQQSFVPFAPGTRSLTFD
jgi:hypothetical protein